VGWNKKRFGGSGTGSISIAGTVGTFFDDPALRKRADAQKLKAMSAAGGYLMKTARRLIRPGGKGNKVSAPNTPPRGHVKPGLRGSIFYALEKSSGGVVVGPVKFTRTGTKKIQALEYGGKSKIGRRATKIKPRPFMGPAKEKALPDFIKKNPHLKKLIGGADVRLPS